MGTLTVSGTLKELQGKLQNIKSVVQLRRNVGYMRFMHDEEWVYLTAEDERVCPRCGPWDLSTFRGDYLKDKFSYLSSVDVVTVETNTHEPTDTNCRCKAEWVNKNTVLVERFHRELVEVSV